MLNLIAKDFKLLFSANGGSKKKLFSTFMTLLMSLFVIGIEWFVFATILDKIRVYQNATVPFLTLFLFIISCLMIVMNTMRANKLFFNPKDIEQLIRRPVSNAQIVASKLVFLFVTHYFMTLLLVLPIIIAYGSMIGKPMWFYYAGVFYPALSFLWEGGVALILVYPFKLLSDFLKKHILVQFVLSILLMVGACVLYSYVLNLFMELVVNNNLTAIFTRSSIEKLIATRKFLVPINFITDIFFVSGIFRMIPYVCIAGGVFSIGVSVVIFAFSYLRSVAMQSRPGKVKDALHITGPTYALFKKEFFLLFKDSNNILSFTGLLIIQPFLVYVIINSINSVFTTGAFSYYMTLLPELIPLIDVLLVMLFTLIINQGANEYIQSEKGNVRVMKILPISPLKQLLIKVLVPFALSAISLLATIVVLFVTKKMSLLTAASAFFMTIVLLVIFDIVSLKEEMRIGNNRPRSTTMSTCYSYLLPFSFFAAAMVSCLLGLDLSLAYLIGFLVFLLLGLPHIIKLRSKMEQMFLDLEMVN